MSTRSAIKRLDELLGPLGFLRRKTTWNRTTGAFVDVIHIQVSKGKDAVTVNIGVLEPRVYSQCWGSEPPAFVDEALCTVRARIGQLMEDHDVWWPLSDDQTDERIAESIVTHGLPFVEHMHTREAMEKFLVKTGAARQKYPPPVIYLALLKAERGDKRGACAVLDELRTRVLGAWQDRITHVAERVGCL